MFIAVELSSEASVKVEVPTPGRLNALRKNLRAAEDLECFRRALRPEDLKDDEGSKQHSEGSQFESESFVSLSVTVHEVMFVGKVCQCKECCRKDVDERSQSGVCQSCLTCSMRNDLKEEIYGDSIHLC